MNPPATVPTSSLPLIGVPACVKPINESPFHAVQEKYLTAIRHAAG